MRGRWIATVAVLAMTACGGSAEKAADGTQPADTARGDGWASHDKRVETVNRRLDEAAKDAESRGVEVREQLDAPEDGSR